MRILGIESSCDETALALVSDAGQEGAVMSSQVDVHALFGGVVPELASREHCRLIRPLMERLWQVSGKSLADVDAVAVTRGPGLLGSLLVGIAFAKGLALAGGLPLIGVNHLHAHLLAAGLEAEIAFPALGVLVSGGHTHLYRMQSPVSMSVMGKTLDDAAGEACDKFAKLAGLPYPGGALLDALAQSGDAGLVPFPRPYTNNESLDFSFSGLKTAAATVLAAHPEWCFPAGELPARERLHEAPQGLRDASASYLQAVADTLAIKTRLALRVFRPGCLVLAGGVAANTFVRRELALLAEEAGLPLLVPRLALCTDNAVMIARTGLLLARAGLRHSLDLPAVPRGKAIPDDYIGWDRPLPV